MLQVETDSSSRDEEKKAKQGLPLHYEQSGFFTTATWTDISVNFHSFVQQ
jgi:hypothetical protein